MTDSKYEFSQHDHVIVKAAKELIDKLTISNLLSPAQRVSVAKMQFALSRLPSITKDFDLRVEITGPRRSFDDIETFHWWTLIIEGEQIEVTGGGHFYRPSTGGDSFSTFHWEIVTGEPSEFIDNLIQLAIVPDAVPFDVAVNRIDFTKAKYSVEVTDSENELLDEDNDDLNSDSESIEDTNLESDDDDPLPGPLQINPVDETEIGLAALIDIAMANRMSPQYAYGVTQCDFCKRPEESLGLFVDGDVRGGGGWANMCAKCFELRGLGIGWGKGQIYARQKDGLWRLVKGFEGE